METKQQLAEGGVSVIQLPSPDSLSTASVKDYAPSFSSEPPPAYHKPRSTAVQVARIAGITLVAASAILGAFLLAAAWITARNSCTHHVVVPMPASHSQGHEHLPSFDRLVDPLQASEQKLEATKAEGVGNAVSDAPTKAEDDKKQQEEASNSDEDPSKQDDDEEGGGEEEEDEEDEGSDQNSEEIPIQIRLPLQLDFDELAGMLMERNMRSRMNCVVEKKRAEEVVEHHPRTLQLPFGLNLTTDPRHEKVSGERMAIFCESGQDQMQQQQRRPEMPFEFIPLMAPQQQPMMQHVQPGPVVVPLPGPVHLPFHFVGPMHQQQQLHPQPPHLHPQAPHLEEPHMNGLFNPPHHQQQQQQQTFHILTPIQHQSIPHEQQQEILKRQLLEQEAMESMRPPPPPMPSAHQLPPHQQGPPVHHMPQMGPVPGQQGPIISIQHLIALAEGSSDDAENEEPQQHTGRAFRGQIPLQPPVHLPLQGNIRGLPMQAPEEHRPHYVQPRSVPSEPFELHRRDKRVKKRCACDCSC